MPAENSSETPRIVVGVDGSPSSIQALRWAVRQARVTGGIVDAIIAWQIPASAVGYGFTPVSAETISGIEENATKVLADAISKATGPQDSPLVHAMVIEDFPAPALISASRDADLLVVGSRGHGHVADALLGSVSLHCVHHARCPVVVIRGPAPDARAA